MAAPETSVAPELPVSSIELSTKPGAKISYTFVPGKGSSSANKPLIVFLNGLGLPASSWNPTIHLLTQQPSYPPLLSYDRYGQGLTKDKDPADATAPDPEHPHSILDVIKDLHQLISQISNENNLSANISNAGIFLVSNSIGGAVSRLYADAHPGTVSALLFLDSVVANTDFVSIFPDPDADDFKEKFLPLPEGVTEEGLRETRAKFRKIFHPSNGVMGKAEGFSRKNLPGLLPDSDKPVLQGSNGKEPWVTVVGHGFETMEQESLIGMGVPVAMTRNYGNPHWHEYNKGLARLTIPERRKGPLLAEKCGHFIQRDDPELVAREIEELLEKLG